MYYDKSMKPLRTRFAKDIVAEFLPPSKPSKKVIIFLSGMPSVPKLADTLNFYAEKGFWVFHPRYRGSWESDGVFLNKSPEQDALDVISQLSKGFFALENGKKYSVQPTHLYLFGCSFGGPAALLASRDKRVTKVVTLSPVIDWQSESIGEPLDWVLRYAKEAYGNAYRLTTKNWQKLASGKFYNPIRHVSGIKGEKILILQAKDDDSVNFQPAITFSKATGAQLVLLHKGGHFSSSAFSSPKVYAKLRQFLRRK